MHHPFSSSMYGTSVRIGSSATSSASILTSGGDSTELGIGLVEL